jgi:hypothetical protein
VDSCISTLQSNAMSKGCFMSYMLVWDPCDFLVFTWTDFVDNMLGYCLDNGWMIAIGWGCWSIMDFPFDTWRLGVVDNLSVFDHIEFSVMSDFQGCLVDFIEIYWLDMILDSGGDPLRHYNLWM